MTMHGLTLLLHGHHHAAAEAFVVLLASSVLCLLRMLAPHLGELLSAWVSTLASVRRSTRQQRQRRNTAPGDLWSASRG